MLLTRNILPKDRNFIPVLVSGHLMDGLIQRLLASRWEQGMSDIL